MAGFLEYGQTAPAENYSGRSRGVDPAKPNQALGTLFEGLGTIVDSTAKVVDNNNIAQLGKELQTGIDAIRGAQGVDAAVNDPSITGGETGSAVPGVGGAAPPGVATATTEIARINQAYKEGKIGDTYYYSKVEALARQVRNKYPGYREQIDQKVSSIIGTNPANAARASILQDLKAAQSDQKSRANSDDAVIERGKQHLAPEKYNEFIRGNRDASFVASLKTDIQQAEVKVQTDSQMKTQYELRKASGSARKEDVSRIATKGSSDIVWGIINKGIDSGGSTTTFESINKKLMDAAATGKPFTPEEIGQIRMGVTALTRNAEIEIDRYHTQGWGKDGSLTIQSEVNDAAELTKIKEQALAPIRNMEKALTDGNMGMFSWYANQAKLTKDQGVQDLLSRSQAARNMQTLQEVFGPNAVSQLILDNPALVGSTVSDITKALKMGAVTQTLGTQSSFQDVLRDVVREAHPNGPQIAKEATGEVIKDARNILVNKNTDPKMLIKAADTLFNPSRNFITDKSLLTGNSQQSVLQAFSAPEMVESMQRLKATNPDTWARYKQWLNASTQAVFQPVVSQLSEWSRPGSGYQVTVDKQGRLTVSADRTSSPGSFPGATTARDAAARGLEKGVGQLNSAIDAQRRIAQADGGDPAAAGLAVVNALGLQLTPTEGGQGAGNPTQGTGGNKPLGLISPIPTTESGAGLYTDTPTPQLQSFLESPRVPDNLKAIMKQELDQRNGTLAKLAPDDRELFIELERQAGPVDLEARDKRRASASYTSDPQWQSAGSSIPQAADLRVGIPAAAKELGIDPIDLATVISYETGGTFDPSIRGGAGNRHIGLIQFGAEEQRMYGANQNQTAGEQLQAVVKYLKHRGFKPGMGILDLYSTINAGSPGRYGASDANNGGAPGTVRDKVNNQMGGHRRRAQALLASQ
jgi:hypothetical protein